MMKKQSMYILGGSSFYTLLLVKSLKQFGVLEQLETITLFGRNLQRLKTVAQSCSELTNHLVNFDISTDLHDALDPKYTLIFNQIRFGGLKARQQDELLANECGFAADETIGIVGVSNAIRAIEGIKPMLEILRQKSTEYRLVNFTNPCSIITQFMVENYGIPAIGVCDYPAYMASNIAMRLNLDLNQLEMNYFGLNHFGVVTNVRYQGKNIFDVIKQTKFDFVPDCGRYSPYLLNISWRFIYEQDALHQEQINKANRATQLLDIDQQLDQLSNDNIDDPNAYLAILNKRQCDWFNLAVSPLLANLLCESQYQTFVNLPAGKQPLTSSSVCVMEGKNNHDYSCIENDDNEALVGSSEYLLIKQMKNAELILLDAILTGDSTGVIRSCLSNPMIRRLEPVLTYFKKLGQLDETLSTIFNQR